MGHQLNFFLTPKDTQIMLDSIGKVEKMLILHSRSDSPAPKPMSESEIIMDRPWLFYHLVRERDLPLVVMDYVPKQGYWTVEVLPSPVIEFSRCFFDGNILRRGRLYYSEGDYDANGLWIAKEESFKKWARRIFAVARKALTLTQGFYYGTDALRWRDTRGGKFVE